jgi:hypothetical protein
MRNARSGARSRHRLAFPLSTRRQSRSLTLQHSPTSFVFAFDPRKNCAPTCPAGDPPVGWRTSLALASVRLPSERAGTGSKQLHRLCADVTLPFGPTTTLRRAVARARSRSVAVSDTVARDKATADLTNAIHSRAFVHFGRIRGKGLLPRLRAGESGLTRLATTESPGLRQGGALLRRPQTSPIRDVRSTVAIRG